MNYTTIGEFGKEICVSLMEIMGNGYEALYREVAKNNGVCFHGVIINRKGSNVSPSIYIDELYEDYRQGRSFNEVVRDVIDVYKHNAMEINVDMNFFTRYEKVKGRILYKLIHWESNIKLLEDVPHIKWNDLALVFYYLFEEGRFGKAAILIKNEHLIMWKIELETLYDNAKGNMPRLKPEELLPIRQVIKEIVLNCDNGGLDTSAGGFMEEEPMLSKMQGPVMYVLSSSDKYFGAAALLYSKSLKMLAKRLNKNLIILPSSVHEVLLLPDDGTAEAAFYKDMVKDVNDTQIEPEEVLSYNVYYYNRYTEQITVFQ